MPWDQLVKIALLGTERSTLSPKLKETLETKGIDTQQESTKVLLDAIAYYSTIGKAGWQPQQWKGKSLTESTTTTTPSCSIKSATHFQTILKIYPKLVPEFVEQLVKNGKALPHEALPHLFNLCLKDEQLWTQLQPAIGERGRWLLPLHRDWKPLQVALENIKWTTGTQVERLALLKQLRQKEPNQALELLQSTWEKDSITEKAKLLPCLKIGLSLADEPFLESCLQASRKEIRQAAAELLARLSTSALSKRVQAHLAELIIWDKKKDTVLLTLPDLSHPALRKDGLVGKKPKNTTTEKIKVLANMIKITPPSFWEQHLSDSPLAIIRLFAQSESSFSLLNALAKATALHPSEEWINAFLEVWLAHYFEIGWKALNLTDLLKVIPNDLYNDFLLKKLKLAKSLPEEDSPLIQLLAIEGQTWNKPLSLLFLQQLREWIQKNATLSWLGQAYRLLLRNRAAYAITPVLHPQISAFWRLEQNNWAGWARDIQHFLNILSFRREMFLELRMENSY